MGAPKSILHRIALLTCCALLALVNQSHTVIAQDNGPFSTWLQSLSLQVPSFTIPVITNDETLFGTLTLNATLSLNCSGLNLAGINSSFVPPHSYQILPYGLTIDCSGSWSSDVLLVNWLNPKHQTMSVEGSLQFSLLPSSLNFTLAFEEDDDGLVKNVTLPSRPTQSIRIGVLKVDIHTAIFEKIFNALLELIESSMKQSIEKLINENICSLLASLLSNNLAPALSNVNTLIRPYLKPPPSEIPPPPIPDAARRSPLNESISNLKGSSLIGALDYLVDRVVGANGPLGINKVMDLLTNHTGSIEITLNTINTVTQAIQKMVPSKSPPSFSSRLLSSPLFSDSAAISIPINLDGLMANISFGLNSLSVDGLDTWSGFRLLQPIDFYTLLMDTKTDNLNITLSFVISVTVPDLSSGSIIAGLNGPSTLVEQGVFHLNLSHSHFSAFMQILTSDPVLNYLDISQFLGGGADCLGSTLIGAAMPTAYFSTQVDDLELLAGGSNSGNVDRDIDNAINSLVSVFVTSYGPALPALFNALFDSVFKDTINSALGSFHNTTIAHAVSKNPNFINYDPSGTTDLADTLCPPPDVKTWSDKLGMTTTNSIIFLSAFSALWLVLAIILYIVYHRQQNARNKLGIKNTSVVNSLLSGPSAPSHRRSFHLNGEGSDECLATHPSVNPLYRYGVPLIILLNIALFASANTGTGADVRARIQWPDHEYWYYPIFSFALGATVKDMWTAGVYPLSIFIALFSGAWPYLKLILMLAVWITPRKFLSRKWRERHLMMLDALGKWSLMDAYVMTLMAVAFHFHIQMPAPEPSPSGVSSGHSHMLYSGSSYDNYTAPYVDAHVDVFVQPDWGIYGFIAATILSLMITHIVLHVHRRLCQPSVLQTVASHSSKLSSDSMLSSTDPSSMPLTPSPSSVMVEKQAVCNYVTKERRRRWGVSLLGKVAVVFLLVSSGVMVVVGSVVESFAFEFAGAISLALKEDKFPYSIVSLAAALPAASNTPWGFGIRFIQVSFLLFAFLVPLAHTIVLVVLWLTPLTISAQEKMLSAVEVLNAWSALEVFVFSIIASILQVRQFAAFIVGDNCSSPPIQTILNILAPMAGSNKCFDVIATLEKGCWILFCAVIQYMVARYTVMKLCHQTIHRRKAECVKRILSMDKDANADSQSDDDDEDMDPQNLSTYARFCKFIQAPFIVEIPRGTSAVTSQETSPQLNGNPGPEALPYETHEPTIVVHPHHAPISAHDHTLYQQL